MQPGTMKLALCVVGCGHYARTVAREMAGLDSHVELFFASRDRDKAKEYCQDFGGSDFFGSYEEAARDDRVEALYFFTPHHLHCENALLAARYRKHTIVEKPIARTLEEAGEIVRAADNAGIKLMVGENARFIPAIRKCKELIDQGAIGDIRLIQIQAEQTNSPTDWRRSLSMNGGGALIDGGIHAVDNLVYLGGMPRKLYATTLPKVLHHVEGEDGIVVNAELKGGAIGLINFSWGNKEPARSPWISVSGTEGRISLDIGDLGLSLSNTDGVKKFSFAPGDYGWKAMIIDFVDSIRQDRSPAMDGAEAMRDLAVVVKAYESARTGMPVTMDALT